METFFSAVKVARSGADSAYLTEQRLRENAKRRSSTSLLLDVNILFRINDYMSEANGIPSDELLKNNRIDDFLRLCRFCQDNQVPYSLSPGFCLLEISPETFDQTLRRYDAFFPMHGIHLSDDLQGKAAKPIPQQHDILSLPTDELNMRAVPFLYLCAMLLINAGTRSVHPWEKFDRFLEILREYVGWFSEKELAVAKVILGDIGNRYGHLFDEEGRDLVKKMRRNFALTKDKRQPRSAEEAIRLAFNGANDLSMITFATAADGMCIDGITQDVWLYSNDRKLTAFLTNLLAYRVFLPDEPGKYVEISLPKGFQTALTMFDAKVFAQKCARSDNRQLAMLNSDLWKVRVQQMIDLMHRAYPNQAAEQDPVSA